MAKNSHYEKISGADTAEDNGQIELQDLGSEAEADHNTRLLSCEDEKSSDDRSKLGGHGLGVLTASLFLVGEIAGAGTLAMPGAMVKAGYGGIGLIVATAFLSAYCGILLGFAWERVKHTKEGTDVQDPYPHIGEMAYSKFGRHAVTFCLNLNLFLACVIYLLLASETISSLLTFHIQAIPVKEEFRVWLVICASILIPLTWFGTPKDFWGIAVGAAGTTAIAAMLITIKCGLVASKAEEPVRQPPVTFISFTSAFGTFVFGFTGAALFPTIQNDMKNSQHFVKAVSFGFAGTFAIYVPVTLAGFLVFGGKVNDSILKTLALYDTAHKTNRAIVSIVEVLFALHFICGFVLMMNPTFQQLEGFFKIKNKFSWQRCLLRSGIVLIVLGTAETFPKFGPVLDLAGGSVSTLLCFIFPCVFYLKLTENVSKFHTGALFTRIRIMIIRFYPKKAASDRNISQVSG